MGDLIPPDFKQCQAYPNVAKHTAFSLGPAPKPIRCEESPIWIAVEVVPGADGQYGSMTLCRACCELMMESKSLRQRVQLQPLVLNSEDTTND